MVQADAGDDGELGREDVGAVQPAAQADLDHGDVHLLVGEPAESQPGGDLEEGESVEVPLRQEAEHVFLRDQGPAVRADEFDPLAEIHQVRGGVEADAQAGGGQGGGQHRADGTLAVGPGHVDGADLLRGMPQGGVEAPHRVQPGLVGPGREPGGLDGGMAGEKLLQEPVVSVFCIFHSCN